MKILIIGDFHYPDREKLNFKELEKLGEYDLVILTGDYTSEKILNFFENRYNTVAVKGNCDYLELNEIEKLKIGKYKILVYHGHKIYPRGDLNKLLLLLEKYDSDILITGHTHIPFFYCNEKCIINPGSFTGARSGEKNIFVKSYAILNINNDVKVKFIVKRK